VESSLSKNKYCYRLSHLARPTLYTWNPFDCSCVDSNEIHQTLALIGSLLNDIEMHSKMQAGPTKSLMNVTFGGEDSNLNYGMVFVTYNIV
jgi:hypothetical protein